MTLLTYSLEELDQERVREAVGPDATVMIIHGRDVERAASAIGKVARGDSRGGVADLTAAFGDADPADIRADVDALVRNAERNADARVDLLREFKAYTREDLSETIFAQADPADRRLGDNDLLAVSYRDTVWYPVFQFEDSGEPLPVIRRILPLLQRRLRGEWERALWFTTPNARLDGSRPVDLLHVQPDRVAAAAEQQLGDDVRF